MSDRGAANGDPFWPSYEPPIVIGGSTATGKTAVAIELAERIGGEIVNADSMQVYREMNVGTAKPTSDERDRIPFHLLDLVDPDEPFNVADWKSRAESAIREIVERGRRPIVCGGTGMYIRALLRDWRLAGADTDPNVRTALELRAREEGSAVLHAELTCVDPETAGRLHPNDAIRIVRALEVLDVTGKPLSERHREDRERRPSRSARYFGLTRPREELYRRIETRVNTMVEAGLALEVAGLLERGYSEDLPALGSLGYKEIVAHLKGRIGLNEAIDTIKKNTRRFAKRQLTWFRSEPSLRWIDVSAFNSAEVAERMQAQLDE